MLGTAILALLVNLVGPSSPCPHAVSSLRAAHVPARVPHMADCLGQTLGASSTPSHHTGPYSVGSSWAMKHVGA